MESARGFLLLALAFLSFLLFQKWQQDYAPKPTTSPEAFSSQPVSTFGEKPTSVKSNIPTEQATQSSQQAVAPDIADDNSQIVELANDVLMLNVDTNGGDLVLAKLKQFKVNLDEPELVTLLTRTNQRTFVAMSDLVGGPDAPTSSTEVRAKYRVHQQSVEDNGDSLLVLTTENDKGMKFFKEYRLAAGSYQVKITYRVANSTNESFDFRIFNRIHRDQFTEESGTGFGIRAYTGAAYSTQDTRYEKYDYDDMVDANIKEETQGGWMAFLQHYFVVAWIPDQNSTNLLGSLVLTGDPNLESDDVMEINILQDYVKIPPQSTVEISNSLYAGPKDQAALAEIADGLDYSVDYGPLFWLSQPIFWLLTQFQSLVVNWGLAIILVTITVKAILYPLASAQYRSFAKLRLLSPKMQQLKERYGDDRQRMSQAMMELYKKEKVNPMGGCLPLLVQMPVFLALYWVLLESYEIRHAPFFGWIQDLSSQDPLFILPVLMGASMFLMQKMQPSAAAMDPMQQKIMQMLPVVMTVFFLFFPAGLVLYWLVNNLLSIAQQLYITNKFNKEHAAKASKN